MLVLDIMKQAMSYSLQSVTLIRSSKIQISLHYCHPKCIELLLFRACASPAEA